MNLSKALKNFYLAILSQILPAGIIAAWVGGILKNPVVAGGMAVGYELLLLAWKEIGKPVWTEVWEQELKPETVKGLAIWISVTSRNLFSSFRSRYHQQLIYDHRVFSVHDLLTPRRGALEVEQVFVELYIAPGHVLQISTNPIAAKTLTGSQSIWAFLRSMQKQEATALAILGPPGSGKTTLLEHLALNFAAKQHRQHRVRPATPILLFLRNHVNLLIEQMPPLGELAQTYFSNQSVYPDLKPPPYWFARQLRNGKCIVLLDGLDEVVDAGHRTKIAQWVDQQIRTYPHCTFLLTARPQGYRTAMLS